ncbi:hypothetical protein NP233_g6211 [Leucocoprinus birnbaumii]|uniref:F-box domain-containing protein n=1 Tax=Leucocoprinus birnbaumii TaxID=56174 RepID=A0AAD5VUY0_9AGAR|nr:hypothetical protein NP233_g6211 [Leucocoprinus birnbaumii]
MVKGQLPTDIVLSVLEYTSFQDLLSIRNVSHRYRELATYIIRCRVLGILGGFVDDPVILLGALDRSNGLISGSCPLLILADGTFAPGDLDVYMPSTHSSILVEFIESVGYRIIHQRGIRDNVCAYSQRSLSHALRFSRTGREHGPIVNVLIGRGPFALEPIFDFDFTFLMNAITGHGIISLYPYMTVKRRTGVINKIGMIYRSRVAKYVNRNFTIDWSASSNGVPEVSATKIDISSKKVFTIIKDPAFLPREDWPSTGLWDQDVTDRCTEIMLDRARIISELDINGSNINPLAYINSYPNIPLADVVYHIVLRAPSRFPQWLEGWNSGYFNLYRYLESTTSGNDMSLMEPLIPNSGFRIALHLPMFVKSDGGKVGKTPSWLRTLVPSSRIEEFDRLSIDHELNCFPLLIEPFNNNPITMDLYPYGCQGILIDVTFLIQKTGICCDHHSFYQFSGLPINIAVIDIA